VCEKVTWLVALVDGVNVVAFNVATHEAHRITAAPEDAYAFAAGDRLFLHANNPESGFAVDILKIPSGEVLFRVREPFNHGVRAIFQLRSKRNGCLFHTDAGFITGYEDLAEGKETSFLL
jgi:hypothetical protein